MVTSKHDTRLIFTARDTTKGAFRSLETNFKKVGSLATGFAGRLVALAGVGGFGLLIKKQLEWGDALGKAADRIGISTKALSGMQLQAELAGVSSETLGKSLEKMNRTLGDAVNGLGTGVKGFERLGLSANELINIDADVAFRKIADEIKGLGTQAEKTAAANEIFGRSGTELLNVLEEGAEGFDRARQEAEDYGLAISRVDSSKLEAANDAFLRVQKIVQGIATQLAIKFAPILEAVANKFVTMSKEAGGFANVAINAFENVVSAVGKVLDIIRIVQIGWGKLENATRILAIEVTRIFARMFDGIIAGYNNTVARIPGIAKITTNVLNDLVTAQEAALSKSFDKVNKLMSDPLPSDSIKDFFREIREETARMEAEMAEGRAETTMTVVKDIAEKMETFVATKREEKKELEAANNIEDVEDKKIHIENILQVEEDAHAKALQGFLRFNNMYSNIQKAYEKERFEFTEKSAIMQTQTVLGELANMTRGVADSNKAMFKGNKMAGIAQGVISTYMGVSKALGAYPFPINITMAAASLAAGMANVAKIKNTQFGSGSVSGGQVGGATPPSDMAPAPPDIPNFQSPGGEQSTRRVTLDLGDTDRLYSSSQIRGLINGINEELGDGTALEVV